MKKTAKEVYLPPVIAYPDFHTAIGAIRDLPLRDPARTTKIDEAQRQYQERVRRAWRWGKDFVLHGQPKEEKPQPKFLNGLAEGNPEPFFHFVKHYGPRGLSFMLANEEILGHIEGWWIESILRKTVLRENLYKIGKELARAGGRGRTRTLLLEEAEQNIKESNTKAKLRFNIKTSGHLEDLQKAFTEQIKDLLSKPKNASKQAIQQQAAQKIAQCLVDKVLTSKEATQRQAGEDFTVWLASKGIHVQVRRKKK